VFPDVSLVIRLLQPNTENEQTWEMWNVPVDRVEEEVNNSFSTVMIVRVAVSAARQYPLRPITPRISSHITVFKFAVNRSYATNRSNASDLLSQTLDVKRGSRREDTVGPFILGVSPSQQSAENVKRWSELSTGGKGVCREQEWS